MVTITDLDKKVNATAYRVGLNLTEALKDKLTPRYGVDTGELKSGIKFKVQGNELIITMPQQGVYLEFGTPPHIIRPRSAKSLSWIKNGKRVFAKVVRHPGTEPFPFIRNTMDQEFTQILVDALNKSFQ